MLHLYILDEENEKKTLIKNTKTRPPSPTKTHERPYVVRIFFYQIHEITFVSWSRYFSLILRCYILTHTSNAKCFGNVTLINIRGLAEIIVPVRGYGRHSPNQVITRGDQKVRGK